MKISKHFMMNQVMVQFKPANRKIDLIAYFDSSVDFVFRIWIGLDYYEGKWE